MAASVTSPAQQPRVRDSAGVHIVANGPREKARIAFALAEPPQFDLGGLKANPDDELNSRGGYDTRDVRLSNGDHAAIDQTKIRFFDGGGKQVRVVGREGEGPQEFGQIASICRGRGDTLVIHDVANGRVSILDRAGAFVREFPVGRADVVQDACFDDGTFLMREVHLSTGTERPPMHVVRRRFDGTVVGTLGDFWSGSYNLYVIPQVSVAASGKHFYIGDPRASEVRIFDLNGKLVGIVRTDDPIAKVTSAEAAALRPLGRAIGPGARSGGGTQAPKPTEWPSYGRITVDPGGRLWIQDTRKDRTLPDVWTAFDRDGKMLGKLRLPPNASRADPRFVSFTADGVQLRREDADGAVHITTYMLKRP